MWGWWLDSGDENGRFKGKHETMLLKLLKKIVSSLLLINKMVIKKYLLDSVHSNFANLNLPNLVKKKKVKIFLNQLSSRVLFLLSIDEIWSDYTLKGINHVLQLTKTL